MTEDRTDILAALEQGNRTLDASKKAVEALLFIAEGEDGAAIYARSVVKDMGWILDGAEVLR